MAKTNQEWMKTDEEKLNEKFPEAPASATTRVISPSGFHYLFTLRDASGIGLLAKIEQFEKTVAERNWQPEANTARNSNGSFLKMHNGENSTNEQLTVFKKMGTSCETCGLPAVQKSGFRKDKSRWTGVFCSMDQNHTQWLQ